MGTTDTAGVLIAQAFASQALGSVAAGTVALADADVNYVTTATLAGNITLKFPTPKAGRKLHIELTQDATGSRTLALSSTSGSVLFPGGTHTLSTAAASIDAIDAVSDGTNWLCTLTKAYA